MAASEQFEVAACNVIRNTSETPDLMLISKFKK